MNRTEPHKLPRNLGANALSPVTAQAVCVVDADCRTRDGFCSLFEAHGHEVEAHATTESFFASPLANTACIVLDLNLGQDCGISILERLAKRGNRRPVVMLAAQGSVAVAVRAMLAGASDFMDKGVAFADLLARVKVLIDDYIQDHEERGAEYRLRTTLEALTQREIEVLAIAARGFNVAETARQLAISERTIETHRSNIARKFDVSCLAELFRIASCTGFSLLREGNLLLNREEDAS